MAASGSTRAATAWIHCARPISAPSEVTTELSDIFWPLKGATETPSRARSRHSPATTVDLPASEVVPHTISAPPRGGALQTTPRSTARTSVALTRS